MNQSDAVCFRCESKGSFEPVTGEHAWRKAVRCTKCGHWHHADTMAPYRVWWDARNPCCRRADGNYCEKHGYSETTFG